VKTKNLLILYISIHVIVKYGVYFLDEEIFLNGFDEILENTRHIESLFVEFSDTKNLSSDLSDIRRRLHTIKSIAASCGLQDILTVVHKQEEQLQIYTSGTHQEEEIHLTLRHQLLYAIEAIKKSIDAARHGKLSSNTTNNLPKIKIFCSLKKSNLTLDLAELTILDECSRASVLYEDYDSYEDDSRYVVEVIFPDEPNVHILEKNLNAHPDIETVRLENISQNLPMSSKEKPNRDGIETGNFNTNDSQFKEAKGLQLFSGFVQLEQSIHTLGSEVRRQDSLLQWIASVILRTEKYIHATNEQENRQSSLFALHVVDLLKTIKSEIHNHEFTEWIAVEKNLFSTTQLKKTVMENQMIELKILFQSFGIYVYKLSKELGKRVRYTYHDMSISIDRGLVSIVSSLLLHCIRNAVDHGIELEKERIVQEKNPEGIIRISGTERSGMLTILIKDDGRGLNLEKIKSKGIEYGFLKEGTEYTNDEIAKLIFLPDFSTKEKATSVSGFGIGLNALQEGLERLGGDISVSTEVGKFTQFTISIPSSFDVQNNYIINEEGYFYALPMHQVNSVRYNNSESDNTSTRLQEFICDKKVDSTAFTELWVQHRKKKIRFRVNSVEGIELVTVFPVFFPVETPIQSIALTKQGKVCFLLHLQKLVKTKKFSHTTVSDETLANVRSSLNKFMMKHQPLMVLECGVRGISLCFPAPMVIEIYEYMKLHSVPYSVPFLRGVVVVNGSPVPVWDIGDFLELSMYDKETTDSNKASSYDEEHRMSSRMIIIIEFDSCLVGLIVDDIVGVNKRKSSTMQVWNNLEVKNTSELSKSLLQAMQKTEKETMLLVHPHQFIIAIIMKASSIMYTKKRSIA